MAVLHFTRIIFIASLLLAPLSAARADFRYVPHAPVPVAPHEDVTAAPASSPDAMPMMPTTRQPAPAVAPTPITTMPLPDRTPTAAMQDYSMAPPASTPRTIISAPPMNAPVTTAPAMSDSGPVAQGFGRNVPLVMALREITPTGYQLGYGNGVPLGAMVDWQGGQPWRTVLKSVLTPLGLQASEQNSIVYIDLNH